VALSLLGIVGIYLIFHFDSKFQKGIIVGMIATFFGVAFSVLNKRMLNNVPPKTIMLYELTGGWLLLTLLMPLYLKTFPPLTLFPSTLDWGWLLLLSWVCTVLAMDLSLQALRHMSVFTQNLTLNLEPVYGIILAFIVFKENKNLNASFYIGFGLIAISVAFQMIRVIKYKKH
jgi:drug/metabolite transporter (DMT)-like permease